MRAILGIDAAWTTTQPTGVALVVEHGDRWRCAALAPSYDMFTSTARGRTLDWAGCAPRGCAPAPERLLAHVGSLCPGADVIVAAVDMPLARVPIEERRFADDEISRTFGGRGIGTHSPSALRPGAVSTQLRRKFVAQGFQLATGGRPVRRALIEVFPHVAVLQLLGRSYRVPYKVGRIRQYWPDEERATQVKKLFAIWRGILDALDREIDGIALTLPAAPETLSVLKRYEDAIDALVCAWVGMRYLAGDAVAYGDASAAIWTPRLERSGSAGTRIGQ